MELITQAYHRGYSSLKTLDESIGILYSGVTMRRSFLETFNEKLGVLMSNGIIERLFSSHFGKDRFQKNMESVGPQVLTIDDLEVGFKICLIPLILSFVAFFFELLIPRVNILLKSSADRLVAVSVVKAFVLSRRVNM